MASGMSAAATDHYRSQQMAEAAQSGFSGNTVRVHLSDNHFPFAIVPQRAVAVANPAKSGRDLDCLTQAVYFEARGESPRGQAAVAQVVLNRVKSPAFPKTVCGVVYQGAAANRGCQFSFACDGSTRRGREQGAWTRARAVAAKALSGVVLADVGSATHFHTTGVSPGWGPQMLQVAQVGLHVFYRFDPHRRGAVRAAEPETVEFVSTPAVTPSAPIRLAAAMPEKAADLTATAAPLPAAPVSAGPEAKPTAPKAMAKPAAPVEAAPPLGLTRTSDAGRVAGDTGAAS